MKFEIRLTDKQVNRTLIIGSILFVVLFAIMFYYGDASNFRRIGM